MDSTGVFTICRPCTELLPASPSQCLFFIGIPRVRALENVEPVTQSPLQESSFHPSNLMVLLTPHSDFATPPFRATVLERYPIYHLIYDGDRTLFVQAAIDGAIQGLYLQVAGTGTHEKMPGPHPREASLDNVMMTSKKPVEYIAAADLHKFRRISVESQLPPPPPPSSQSTDRVVEAIVRSFERDVLDIGDSTLLIFTKY
ncbi:hypothetical protein QQS21_009373 [Conoideocrella luteorostrata]|uniref:Uncharacterized protein n=1 Tax=Conoideocrella luteorostrata TaxID=1105319 RepID=A0AAJ0CH17_9HYPO|nr:hypothetical protein QQS21_009373 [Conoideocrella luteorostrata]